MLNIVFHYSKTLKKTSYLSGEVCRSCDVENGRGSMHQSFTQQKKKEKQ